MLAQIILLLTGTSVAADSYSATYPGGSPLSDPSGRWLVEWREAALSQPHQLILKEQDSQTVVSLLEFNRRVEVLWAPDGGALAITDYGASNYSEIKIIRPSWRGNIISV